MEKKKMMIATCIFGLTYGFVAYYEQLRGTENLTIIDQTVFKHMDSSLAIVLAVLITIIYLTFVYKRNKKSEFELLQNQRIIAGNAQFTGIAAGRGVGFTTGLLLLREGLGMRETPIRPHSWH